MLVTPVFSTVSKRENGILPSFNLSSAHAFNLVATEILSFGKGLKATQKDGICLREGRKH